RSIRSPACGKEMMELTVRIYVLALMEARGEDQGAKPLQAYARSVYWSVIWPSITSRYMYRDAHGSKHNLTPFSWCQYDSVHHNPFHLSACFMRKPGASS